MDAQESLPNSQGKLNISPIYFIHMSNVSEGAIFALSTKLASLEKFIVTGQKYL